MKILLLSLFILPSFAWADFDPALQGEWFLHTVQSGAHVYGTIEWDSDGNMIYRCWTNSQVYLYEEDHCETDTTVNPLRNLCTVLKSTGPMKMPVGSKFYSIYEVDSSKNPRRLKIGWNKAKSFPPSFAKAYRTEIFVEQK